MIKFKFLKNMLIITIFLTLMNSCANEDVLSKAETTESVISQETTDIKDTTEIKNITEVKETIEVKDTINDDFIETEGSMDISITSNGSSTCLLSIDYYNGDPGSAAVKIFLNGACVKQVELPTTNSWDSLGHIDEEIVLNDGENKIILDKAQSPNVKIENLSFSSSITDSGSNINIITNVDGQSGVTINNNFEFD